MLRATIMKTRCYLFPFRRKSVKFLRSWWRAGKKEIIPLLADATRTWIGK